MWLSYYVVELLCGRAIMWHSGRGTIPSKNETRRSWQCYVLAVLFEVLQAKKTAHDNKSKTLGSVD